MMAVSVLKNGEELKNVVQNMFELSDKLPVDFPQCLLTWLSKISLLKKWGQQDGAVRYPSVNQLKIGSQAPPQRIWRWYNNVASQLQSLRGKPNVGSLYQTHACVYSPCLSMTSPHCSIAFVKRRIREDTLDKWNKRF